MKTILVYNYQTSLKMSSFNRSWVISSLGYVTKEVDSLERPIPYSLHQGEPRQGLLCRHVEVKVMLMLFLKGESTQRPLWLSHGAA